MTKYSGITTNDLELKSGDSISGISSGDLRIVGDASVSGASSGDIDVAEGATLRLSGSSSGDILIAGGASASIGGSSSGDIDVRAGGRLELSGASSGRIRVAGWAEISGAHQRIQALPGSEVWLISGMHFGGKRLMRDGTWKGSATTDRNAGRTMEVSSGRSKYNITTSSLVIGGRSIVGNNVVMSGGRIWVDGVDVTDEDQASGEGSPQEDPASGRDRWRLLPDGSLSAT